MNFLTNKYIYIQITLKRKQLLFNIQTQLKMSQQHGTKDNYQPIYPIPIISTPQPLVPTINKIVQNNTKEELEAYKKQYFRLLKENNLLLSHLNKVTKEKQELQAKYNSIQVDRPSQEEKRKRVRRTAGEIVREFSCLHDKCGKSYGTEASLAQHVKLKHPDSYGTKQYQEHINELRKKIAVKSTHTQSNQIGAAQIPYSNQQ